jgi:toxin ParE1/3/4
LEEIAYLEARSPGLGKRFYREVVALEKLILKFPDAGAPRSGRVRALPLDRFPHLVYYAVEGDVALILAVAHPKRSPDYWRSR